MKTQSKSDHNEEQGQSHSTDTRLTYMRSEGEQLDGLPIENWLAKQYEMATAEKNFNNQSSVSVIPHEGSRTFPESCDTASKRQVHIGEPSLITRMPSQHSIYMNNGVHSESTRNEGGDVDDNYEVLNEALNLERAEITLMTNGDIFVPVLLTTTIPNDQLLIEGVKVVNTKRRTICRVTGSLLLVAIIAFTATMLAISWVATPDTLTNRSNETLISLAGDKASTSTIAPISPPVALGNTNWTIADALIDSSKHGDVVSLTRAASGRWFLQSTLNRTDKNYTFFRVNQSSDVVGDLDPTFISKFISPMWNGHLVSRECFSQIKLTNVPCITTHT